MNRKQTFMCRYFKGVPHNFLVIAPNPCTIIDLNKFVMYVITVSFFPYNYRKIYNRPDFSKLSFLFVSQKFHFSLSRYKYLSRSKCFLSLNFTLKFIVAPRILL